MPGPGAYEVTATESKNGFCFHSRYKSYGATTISRSGKRFDNSHLRSSLENPGPG